MTTLSKQTAKVLLPLIKNAAPSIIANEIIGTQPVFSVADDGFSLKNVRLTKEHYRYFLRVYNRRKFHTVDYIDSLGYPSVKLTRRDDSEYNALKARVWAIDNLKSGSYINSVGKGKFWFAREQDYTLFLLKWGGNV